MKQSVTTLGCIMCCTGRHDTVTNTDISPFRFTFLYSPHRHLWCTFAATQMVLVEEVCEDEEVEEVRRGDMHSSLDDLDGIDDSDGDELPRLSGGAEARIRGPPIHKSSEPDDIDDELPSLAPCNSEPHKSPRSSAMPATCVKRFAPDGIEILDDSDSNEELPSLRPDGFGQEEKTTPLTARTYPIGKSSGLDDLDGLEESDEEPAERRGHVRENTPPSSSAEKTPATIKSSGLDDLDGLDDSDDELRGAEHCGAPQFRGLVTETRPKVSFQKMEMKPLRVSGAPARPALPKSAGLDELDGLDDSDDEMPPLRMDDTNREPSPRVGTAFVGRDSSGLHDTDGLDSSVQVQSQDGDLKSTFSEVGHGESARFLDLLAPCLAQPWRGNAGQAWAGERQTA